MIREYEQDDKEQIKKILEEGLLLDPSYLEELEDEAGKVFVEEQEGIRAFCLILPHQKATKRWNVDIYVEPNSRRQKIGSQLHEKALDYLKEVGVGTLSTKGVVDQTGGEVFFKQLGYKTWFGFHEMVYKGQKKDTVNKLVFKNYEEAYYEKYVKLIAEGFYELREANDIWPYTCMIPTEVGRRSLLEDKKNIYLAVDEKDEMIATVNVKKGHIDDLVVSKAYENQGLGKQVTVFAINQAYQEGAKEICLDVVMWNEKARHVYETLGFQVVQSFKVYRQYVER